MFRQHRGHVKFAKPSIF